MIVELRKITSGLDVVIGAVGEILTKTEPVAGVVKAINADLSAGTELLEGLLAEEGRAGRRPPGWSSRCFPAPAPRCSTARAVRATVKNIDDVYTRGAVQLARLGRESPLGAGAESGVALRDAAYSSAAARALYSNPAGPDAGMRSRPRSPTIGTGAPAVYPEREADEESVGGAAPTE